MMGIVCMQLSIPTDAVAFSNSHFGAGIGTIHLNVVSCTGREANLTDCPQIYSTRHCFQNHSEDAGVRCQGLKTVLKSISIDPSILHVSHTYGRNVLT